MSKNLLHIERLKAIRPFVEFNFNINEIKKGNLSNYDKRKIKKYFDEISRVTSRNNYVYRPRKNDRKKLAQEYSGIKNLKELKAIPIPVANPNKKPKLKFKKDRMMVESNSGITSTFTPFNKNNLIQNFDKEIIRAANETPNANSYVLVTESGELLGWRAASDPESLAYTANDFATIYGTSKNLFIGVKAYFYGNDKDFSKFRKDTKKRREERQRIKKQIRRTEKKIANLEFSKKYADTDRNKIRIDANIKTAKENIKNLKGKL